MEEKWDMKFLLLPVTSLQIFFFICLRFLKARKFDMDKTLNMWTEMLSWRKDNHIDTIMQVMWDDACFFCIYIFFLCINRCFKRETSTIVQECANAYTLS